MIVACMRFSLVGVSVQAEVVKGGQKKTFCLEDALICLQCMLILRAATMNASRLYGCMNE